MPLNALGQSEASSLYRIVEKTKIIIANPKEVPKAVAMEVPKSNPWSVFPCTTPKTAQFVVISGKYTPKAL